MNPGMFSTASESPLLSEQAMASWLRGEWPTEIVKYTWTIHRGILNIDTLSVVYVGALHVLPEHRRQGLAEILVMDLCRQYAAFFRAQLPTVPLDQLHAGACVEMFNDASAGLFKKTGFKAHGLGTTWIHCCRK